MVKSIPLPAFILATPLVVALCYAATLPQTNQLLPAGHVSDSAAPRVAVKPMEYQVGGHPGFSVLEEVQQVAKPYNAREETFYVLAQQSPYHDSPLYPFMPHYYGTKTAEALGMSVASENVLQSTYLLIEDATAGFKRPNILDLTLGSRLYDEEANEEKRNKMIKKAQKTLSGTLGFRFAGMQVIDPMTGTPCIIDRDVLRKVTKDTAQATLASFFPDMLNPAYRRQVVACFHHALDQLSTVFNGTPALLIGASILVVYEGDATQVWSVIDAINDEFDPSAHCASFFRVRIIDFAHSTWTDKGVPRDDYQTALTNIRQLLTGV
ncbi:hypothetical protein H4R34_001137 [Dimargaris verticillata]|uniref:Kinase n=1 Tax=Dimargaris verticillata TaxID=2761393 RepID=A0A9W8BBZ7_9FUNG|nr:hypothetical protein H4R34_001137 [Dimargaris verticillata]